MEKVEKVDWQDVQGLVLSGYPKLPFAAYVPWRFVSPVSGHSKAWLRDLIGRLKRVLDQPEPERASGQPLRPTSLKTMKMLRNKDSGAVDVSAVNVALTATGLTKLGVGGEELSRFSAEFREGMAPEREPGAPIPRRCNILGDIGENSPQHWQWGGWNANREIDGMLLLYAANENSLEKLIKYETEQMRGVEILEPVSTNKKGGALILKGRLYDDLKEHFGFADGFSQPIIAGTPEARRKSLESPKEARISVVKPGEFVLGYLNERGTRVSYSSASGPGAHRSKAAKEGSRDLARNGTHLVFRQLEQDVRAFRRFISRTARRMRGDNSLESQKWVAARLIGREQDGNPLIPPSADSPKAKKRNDFLYYFEDRFGLRCPLGAHIRRANPRDFVGPDPDTALRLSKMHRIIRRGRPYGKRLLKSARGQDEQRGMLIICLNADIAGQFELIQHSWINNGRFSGLYGETDPIMHYPGEDRVLTIQRRPTCERVNSLHQFVKVRGGAYFFLPGIQTLRLLAG